MSDNSNIRHTEALFFCMSNLSMPVVLTLLRSYRNFRIVTDQESIARFLYCIVNENQVVLLPKSPVLGKIAMLFKPIIIRSHKKKIEELIGKPKGVDVYFFYNAFAIEISWWLSRNYQTNFIHYAQDIDISMWRKMNNPIAKLKTLWIRVCYNVHTVPVWTGKNCIPKVSNRFLQAIGAKITSIDISRNYISDLISKKLDLNISNDDIIMLTGNSVEDNLIEKNEFVRVTDQLINIISKERILIKVHPRFNYLYSKETECRSLPNYVPVNILLPLLKTIIGYSSAVLFEAANQGKVAISLIDYYKPISEERREEYRKYLNRNLEPGRKIHYPQSAKDILTLLKKTSDERYSENIVL